MRSLKSLLAISIALVFLSVTCSPAWSVVPEPKSAGEFTRGKGTKTEESYKNEQAEGPVYEYGKGFLFGALHIKPTAEYGYVWDNNIFYDDSGRREDWIHKLIAGAEADLPVSGGQHTLTAGYKAEAEYFDRFEEQDHVDHSVSVGGEFSMNSFSFSINDVFETTVDRADTEFTNRVKREENALNALLEVPFAQFFLETELLSFDIDYQDDPLNERFDHIETTIFQRAGLDVAPSTQLLVEYGFTEIHYSHAADREGDAHQTSVGLRGYLGERTSYQIWTGAQTRIYEADERPDFTGVIVRSAVQYDFSEESSIVFRANRGPHESTFDDQSFYVRNRAELEWRQQVAERVFVSAKERVDYNEYSRISLRGGDDETRRDYVWQSGLGAEYFMPNELISFYCEYLYKGRDSNTFLLDYDAQTVTVGVRSIF